MAGQERDDQDLSEQFEALLGRGIGVEDPEGLAVTVYTGLYQEKVGGRTSRVHPGSTKSCSSTGIVTVGGVVATRANGRVTFRLSDFRCRPGFHAQRPIICVANARTDSPVFVTTVTRIVPGTAENDGYDDVEITLFAWDPGGNPVTGVQLRWICQVSDATGGVE
jgi:hypothetical protein